MCDKNHTVIFDKYGYGIYEGEVSVEGIQVYAQNRHPLTGLYPIYLTTDGKKGDINLPEAKNLLNKFSVGQISLEKEKKNIILFTSLRELREKNVAFVVWAQNMCNSKERHYTDEQQELDMLGRKEIYLPTCTFLCQGGDE